MSLREERLGEKGGAFFNGKEGRVDFRKTVRKSISVFEPFDMKEKDLCIITTIYKSLSWQAA